MPYTWVAAETFLCYRGVYVYHCYKNDQTDSCRYEYHYTLDASEESDFDIRDLQAYDHTKRHQEILKAAIDSGELLPYGMAVEDLPAKDARPFTGQHIDPRSLPAKAELLAAVESDSSGRSTLSAIAQLYRPELKIAPINVCPAADKTHTGAAIFPVREGFLRIPYCIADQGLHEVSSLKDVKLLDSGSVRQMLSDIVRYYDDLCDTLNDIACCLEEEDACRAGDADSVAIARTDR